MQNIYQHFRDTEKEFIDLAIDWIRRVSDTYAPYLTSFLDPREQYIVQTIAGQDDDIQIAFDGGYPDAERKRCILYPNYLNPEDLQFELALCEIDYPQKFANLSHGQIMGSVLGSGITRDKLGDIIHEDGRWQFIIDEKMQDFILMQVDKIGRTSVKMRPSSFEDLIKPDEEWQSDTEIISSKRLDVFISAVLNNGREKTKQMIDRGMVKLNWAPVEKANIIIEENDMISVRGFGRIQLVQVISETKKNKLLVEVKKLLHKS